MQINVIDALNCLTLMRMRQRHCGQVPKTKIGIVNAPIRGEVAEFHFGNVVLFTPSEDGTSCQIETPMTLKEIGKEVARGSLLLTKNSMVGAPLQRVNVLILSEDDLV